MKPPCLIIYNRLHGRYEAYNEDGRLIGFRPDWASCTNLMVTCFWYESVSPNSRIGRTILDKITNNHPF